MVSNLQLINNDKMVYNIINLKEYLKKVTIKIKYEETKVNCLEETKSKRYKVWISANGNVC